MKHSLMSLSFMVVMFGCGGDTPPADKCDDCENNGGEADGGTDGSDSDMRLPFEDGETGFLVPPISGLSFSSGSYSGKTNDGAFNYDAGAEVTFSIGPVLLGVVDGDTAVQLFDVVAGAAPTLQPSLIDVAPAQIRGANVFRLLLALDANQDWSDGITLPDEVASFFDGVDEFSFDDWRFGLSSASQAIVTNAITSGAIPEGTRIPSSGLALSWLYEALALRTKVPTELVIDRAGEVSTVAIAYNDRGMIERIDVTYPNGATSDEYTHNERGEFTRWVNTTRDRVQTYISTFGTNGLVESREVVIEENGATSSSTANYLHDERGNLVGVDVFDPNNRISYRTIRMYDSENRETSEIFDDEGDGTPDRTITRTYDGNVTTTVREGGLDGRVVRTFNNWGFLERVVRTGANEETQVFEYDANNNLLSAETDVFSDGEVNEVYLFVRRLDGQLERQEQKISRATDPRATKTISYDEDGYPVMTLEEGSTARTVAIEYVETDKWGHLIKPNLKGTTNMVLVEQGVNPQKL